MYIIPVALVFIVAVILTLKLKAPLWIIPAALVASMLVTIIIISIDYSISTQDSEVWSGRITDVVHKEEWDEWHPPKIETYTETYTDSSGKTKTREKTRVIPGYTEHHYAENYVTTSDEGEFSVDVTPDGKKLDDNFVNSTDELKKYYPIGKPSASVHSYQNKVQASYSIYKHGNINLKDYPNLPDYPETVKDYTSIDRIIGNVPQKQKALDDLANWNAELNKTVPDPDNPGKTRSYKQVNIIFVNLGNVPEENGFALQDKWEGGNKNDFVIAFGTDSQNNVTWAYPFSWSEVEILKIEVRDYMLDQKGITDFSKIVDDVSKKVENEFVRKQFADFSYLSVQVSTTASVIIWVFNIFIMGATLFVIVGLEGQSTTYRRNRNRNNIRW